MTTKDPFYKVGYNILCLRKSYNETASDLADAVGVGKSAISEYETGSRGKIPPRNVLVNTAKHYGVTVDDLIEGDFTDCGLGDLSKVTVQALQNLTRILLPVISSNKALRNSSFKKAYELHKKMWDGVFNNITFSENDLDRCIRWYEKASEEGVVEASANILWWYIIFGGMISNMPFLDSYQEMYEGTYDFEYLVKNAILPNFGDTNPHDIPASIIKEIKNYASIIDEDFFHHLKLLKRSECADIGDYYFALRYLFALNNNDRSIETNKTMGNTLMSDLVFLGNRFARNYIIALHKLTE